jgi:hypothetical protein
MIEATVDKSQNLLTVVYSGQIGAEETKRSLAQVEPKVMQMQPGFRLLSDLRRLEVMDLGCVPYIEQVMDLCDDREIAMVVRIIPDPQKDIGLNIMSLFHYRRGVRIVTCETMEEAEAALARPT